jgi:hypothetical protein
MHHRALYLAVASCFALTGCPDKPEPPKPKTAAAPNAATPKPPEAPAAPPASSSQDKVAGSVVTAMEGQSKDLPCKSNKCEVHVTVTRCNGDDNDIKATPDPVYIGKGNKAKIHWIIDSPGYTFTANGVGWKTAAGKGEFEDSDPGAREYKWKNKDKPPGGKWDYWIELNGPNKTACKKDPTVVNGVPDPTAPAVIPPVGAPGKV